MILKNRKSRGGGVGIAYDKNAVKLKKISNSSRFEFVCAVGNTKNNKRPIVVIAYYVPPSIKADEYKQMAADIEDAICDARQTVRDPLIVIAGDSNRRNTSAMHEDYEEISDLHCPPSRGGSALISCATNINEDVREVFCTEELEDEDGQKSDHKIVVVKADLPRQDYFDKKKIKIRPYTAEGEKRFGSLLMETNWEMVRGSTSSRSAEIFANILSTYTDICFPKKEITLKSSDLPWATKEFKRKVRQRNRCFKYEGKTRRWRRLKEEAADLLYNGRMKFLGGMEEKSVKDGSSRAFFKAINKLKHRNAPKPWNIRSMFPGESDKSISEQVAEYFNRISQEYERAPSPEPTDANDFPVPERYKISARLKYMKKPKGLLKGDIDPRLNVLYCDVLSEPLSIIYSKVAESTEWPVLWKTEQVTVIPKNNCPQHLSELRNLSCTPLYSKLLESFVLEELKRTTSLSESQYGGVKGCGVDHFLVDTWNTVLSHLEDNRAAVNLVSIDFEKAFNRMDHSTCIEELRKAGASRGALGMVKAFLHQRTMMVKIGDEFSTPRMVPGGVAARINTRELPLLLDNQHALSNQRTRTESPCQAA